MADIKKIQEKVFSALEYRMSPKCVLMLVNFVFMITGIVLIVVGTVVPASFENYQWFLSSDYFGLSAFFVATGIVTVIIAVIPGLLAVFIENLFIRILFVTSLIVMFTLQVFASGVLFTLRDNSLAHISNSMRSSISLYAESPWARVRWDTLQRDFQCCGIDSASDWIDPLGTQQTQGLPISCCPFPYESVHIFECTTSVSYEQVCIVAFPRFIMDKMWTMGSTEAVVAGIQVLLIICAICAIKSARSSKIATELLPRPEKQ